MNRIKYIDWAEKPFLTLAKLIPNFVNMSSEALWTSLQPLNAVPTRDSFVEF